ncbi:temptin-like isoform X3 [Crassostrea virginica]
MESMFLIHVLMLEVFGMQWDTMWKLEVELSIHLDFVEAGESWTQTLCSMDSDNDGRINGFELGDFNCSWFEGQPPMGDATGHPGICEPMDDPKCIEMNKDVSCR